MVRLPSLSKITETTGPYSDEVAADILEDCLGDFDDVEAFSKVLRSALTEGWTDLELGQAVGRYLRRSAESLEDRRARRRDSDL